MKYQKRVFTRAEIYAAIDKSPPRVKAMIALLYLTGARISELVGMESRQIPPVRVCDINEEEYAGAKFLVVRMPVIKRKRAVYKEIPLPLADPLTHYVAAYISGLPPAAPLFGMTRYGAWKVLKRVGINPHSLRHSRLTELASYFSYGQLYKFAGWRLEGADEEYVHLGWRDYAPALLKATEERAARKPQQPRRRRGATLEESAGRLVGKLAPQPL